MLGSKQDNFVEFSPGKAWHSYPPKKTLLPSDDFIEASAFQAAGGKNKTRKDKRKKYKTKKKIETIKQKIKKISQELR